MRHVTFDNTRVTCLILNMHGMTHSAVVCETRLIRIMCDITCSHVWHDLPRNHCRWKLVSVHGGLSEFCLSSVLRHTFARNPAFVRVRCMCRTAGEEFVASYVCERAENGGGGVSNFQQRFVSWRWDLSVTDDESYRMRHATHVGMGHGTRDTQTHTSSVSFWRNISGSLCLDVLYPACCIVVLFCWCVVVFLC